MRCSFPRRCDVVFFLANVFFFFSSPCPLLHSFILHSPSLPPSSPYLSSSFIRPTIFTVSLFVLSLTKTFILRDETISSRAVQISSFALHSTFAVQEHLVLNPSFTIHLPPSLLLVLPCLRYTPPRPSFNFLVFLHC